MNTNRSCLLAALLLMLLLTAAQPVCADGEEVIGLWQYEEIVTGDMQPSIDENGDDTPGVLLSDLDAMPLDLLNKVFGKLSYSAAFTDDQRFDISIKVFGMRFVAQGEWSLLDGRMTLIYDQITGFEKLWWLGGFDHLTHCDSQHTLTETVAYIVTKDNLTFLSSGAKLVFTRE